MEELRIEANGNLAAFEEPQFDGAADQYPFHFLPYPSNQFGDGSTAHLPWLQEMPDPLTSAMWSSWVEINERKAEELGIHQGDVLEITSTQGSLRAPAFLSPGIAPDAIAIPVGQGHTNFTRYATNRGVNPVVETTLKAESPTFAPAGLRPIARRT